MYRVLLRLHHEMAVNYLQIIETYLRGTWLKKQEWYHLVSFQGLEVRCYTLNSAVFKRGG